MLDLNVFEDCQFFDLAVYVFNYLYVSGLVKEDLAWLLF